jgi:hypothetical protein
MKNSEKLKIAFENYFKAFNELKALGVTKNKKDFTSQLGVIVIKQQVKLLSILSFKAEKGLLQNTTKI